MFLVVSRETLGSTASRLTDAAPARPAVTAGWPWGLGALAVGIVLGEFPNRRLTA